MSIIIEKDIVDERHHQDTIDKKRNVRSPFEPFAIGDRVQTFKKKFI